MSPRFAVVPLAIAASVASLGGVLAVVEERPPLSELAALRALDTLPAEAPLLASACRSAFSAVNERWLEHLPTMATMRAENAVAEVALRLSGMPVPSRDTAAESRVARLSSAGWSAPSMAREAAAYASGKVLTFSGLPAAGFVVERMNR